MKNFVRHRAAVMGLVAVVVLIGLSLSADFLYPRGPLEVDMGRALAPPSREHIFGNDGIGRDLFSRVLYGLRVSLMIGLVSVGVGLVLGVPLGFVAGYTNSKTIDNMIMRLIDILMSFPGILLALIIVVILGAGFANVSIAFGVTVIPAFTRLIRGQVLSIKEKDYVLAAKSLGIKDFRIILRHVLPNCSSPLIVASSLEVPEAIMYAASLGFLGLGVQPPAAELGVILSEARVYIQIAWWLVAFPGIALIALVLGLNLMGDGIRDALDPNLRIEK